MIRGLVAFAGSMVTMKLMVGMIWYAQKSKKCGQLLVSEGDEVKWKAIYHHCNIFVADNNDIRGA